MTLQIELSKFEYEQLQITIANRILTLEDLQIPDKDIEHLHVLLRKVIQAEHDFVYGIN